MNKILIVVTDMKSDRSVLEENGVQSFDFVCWRDRLAQLTNEGWVLTDTQQDTERNRAVYRFEKEPQWEYTSYEQIDSEDDSMLNEMGEERWELVSSTALTINERQYYKHYFKRQKK